MWLRAGRTQRKLSLEDIARVTKIQPRILEKLEAGQLEGLPADVFVRGFVRSFARCVGLDESEALQRYGACAGAISSPVVRALVDTISDLAPVTARKMVPVPAVEAVEAAVPIPDVETIASAPVEIASVAVAAIPVAAIPVAAEPAAVLETSETPKKKRARKKPGTTTPRPRQKKSKADAQTQAEIVAQPESEIVATSPAIEVVEISAETDSTSVPVVVDTVDAVDLVAPALADGSVPVITLRPADDEPANVWHPTMPPSAPSVPWRRPMFTTPNTAAPRFVLAIDDSDPELAELERQERDAREDTAKGPHRVSFLPPILLDREDKSARQGGLTLAVIILLIAATLTLSYLMRRPSVSGDGVTMAPTTTTTTTTAETLA